MTSDTKYKLPFVNQISPLFFEIFENSIILKRWKFLFYTKTKNAKCKTVCI